MSNVNVKVNADTKVNINTSDAIDRLKSLENQYKLLLRQISSSPDTASLKGYVNNLNAIAQKMRDIASASKGINMSGVEGTISRLSGVGNQLVAQQRQVLQSPTNVASVNTAAETKADNIKSKLMSVVKTVSDSAKSALKQTANIAKSIISTSASLLKSAFSKSLDFIKSKFTSIFSAKQTSGIADQFKKLLLGAGVVKSIKTMIDYSSSLTETINRIDYVFKDSADSVKDWAKSNVDSFGLTEGSALKFASTFGGILNASGVASDKVAGLSENLTEMTGDLSSFYDIDQDVFFKKLQSGLSGNSAALRTFGINVSATNLELYRQSQGIKTAYKDMDQASRVILRYNYIVDSAKDASGDFARTQYTWANQARLLKQQFISLGTILGGFFVKSLLPVIQVLNQVFAFAVRAATAVAKLFGFDQESIKDLVSGIGAISDDSAGYIDDTADALGNEADALDDTGKAAKEAAENLQGFDKLSNITTDKSSGTSGKGAGTSGVGGAGLSIKDWGDGLNVTKEQTEFEKWLDDLYNILAEREWKKAGKKVADGLNLVTYSLYGKLTNPENREKIHGFNDAITDFYDGLLYYDTEALGRTIGAGINLITFSINDLYETASEKGLLTKTGAKIAEFFSGLVTGVKWKDVGKAFTTGFRAAMDVLSGFLKKAKENDLAKNVGNAIKDFLKGAVERLFGDDGAKEIGENISGVVNFALESFATAFSKDADGNSVVDDIADSILTVINTAIEGIDENDLADALTALLNVIGTLFGMLGNIDTDTLSDKISYAINTAADNGSLSDAASGIASAILNVFNLLGKTFEKIDWSSVITAIWKGLKKAFETTNGEGYIFPVFATLFGVKLLGKVASWGLHAIGSKILSLISGGISSGASTVGSALSGLFSFSNLTKFGVYTAVAAMGVKVASAIAGGVKDGLDQSVGSDEILNDMKEKLSGTLTFTVDPSAYSSLTDYRNKLKELQGTYNAISQLVDDWSFGEDDMTSIRDLTAYVEELEKAGAGGSTAVKNLKKAIDEYNNSSFMDKSAAFDNVYSLAQDLNIEFSATTDTLDSLNDIQFDALDENFSKLKQNTSFSADEVNELTATWSNAGEQLSKGLLDKTNETLNTDTSVDTATSSLIADATAEANSGSKAKGKQMTLDELSAISTALSNDTSVDIETSSLITGATADENTGAKSKGSGVGTSLTDGVSSALLADTSVKTNTSGLVSKATTDENTQASAKGKDVGNWIGDGISDGANDKKAILEQTAKDLAKLVSKNENIGWTDKAKAAGGFILDGIQSGLADKEKQNNLFSGIAGVANGLITKFRNVLGINSPSRVFASFAEWIPAGIGVGIEENASSAYKAVSNMCSGLTDEFENSNINTNALISDEKFDTMYASLMKQTDMAVDYVANKLDTLRDMLNMQSSLVVNPSVGKANLQAAYASEASSAGVVNSLGSIYSKLITSNLGGSNKPVQVNVYLDQNNKLSSYIINTVNGNITKTGNF